MMLNTVRGGVLATLLAFPAFADVSPMTVDGAKTVSVDQAAELFDNGTIFVDVRKPSDFEAGRIPGAVHLDSKTTLNKDTLSEVAAKTDPVVFYCNGENCMRSSEVSERAVGWGYETVFYFRDGYPAWDAAGMPVE